MKLCLLLVLLCLPALSLALTCAAGSTKDSGCADCASNTAADSDCNWCKDGFYKSTAKTCTACPNNTGRREPFATVTGTETEAVCWKCAPQLKCKTCNDDPYQCSECATGSYRESGKMFGHVSITGCSTDCKTFAPAGDLYLIPNTQTPPATYCVSYPYNCIKASYTSTLKRYANENPQNPQTTLCQECNTGFYLVPDKDPTVVPSCQACGANCKKCKDRTECNECFPGWAFEGSAKDACIKAVASSASLLQGALLSILALFIAW